MYEGSSRNVGFLTIALIFIIFSIWNTYAPFTQGWGSEVWAAWAQAVLSGLAIYAAARLATNQERKTISRRIGVLVELMRMASSEAFRIKTLFGVVRDEVPREDAYRHQAAQFEQYRSAFRGFPLEDVADGRLLVPINNVAIACGLINRLLANETPRNGSPELRKWLKDLDEAQFGLHECLAKARAVQADYSPVESIAWLVSRAKKGVLLWEIRRTEKKDKS